MPLLHLLCPRLFFFNDTATTEIYPLSLHDALPISAHERRPVALLARLAERRLDGRAVVAGHVADDAPAVGLEAGRGVVRSEEHTSELQSQSNLVCRLLLEKKKKRY